MDVGQVGFHNNKAVSNTSILLSELSFSSHVNSQQQLLLVFRCTLWEWRSKLTRLLIDSTVQKSRGKLMQHKCREEAVDKRQSKYICLVLSLEPLENANGYIKDEQYHIEWQKLEEYMNLCIVYFSLPNTPSTAFFYSLW